MRATIRAILAGMAMLSAVLIVDCPKALAKTAMEQGEEACKKRDYDSAIKFFSEAIRISPKGAEAYHCRGTCYQCKKDSDKALADFNEALRLDSASAKAYSSRAELYHAKREYDKAIADFSEVVRLCPNDAVAFQCRGSDYEQGKGDHNKAIADYTEAIRLAPNNATRYLYLFHLLRAESYVNQGKLDKGIADFSESIRLNPIHVYTYFSRSLAYLRKDDVDKAIADLTEAIRLSPDSAKLHYCRAVAEMKNSAYDKAIADLTAAIGLDPKDGETYFLRGMAYLASRETAKATADLNKALRIDPNNVVFQRQVAELQKPGDSDGKIIAVVNLDEAAQRLASLPEQKKTQAPGFYRMMIGSVEITALCDGIVELDAALLKNVSEVDRDALLKRAMIEDPHKLPTSTNAYLINTGAKLVLVDAGGGTAFPGLGHLLENLKASGYKPEEVDAVLITHLHPDHMAGLIDAKGKPVFPKAVVYVAKAENDYWLSEADPEVPAMYKEHLKKARKQVRDTAKPYIELNQWRTFEDGKLPILGIKAVAIPGHTPGHTAYEIQSGGQTLLIIGDTVHVAAVQFARPDAAVSFDSDPKQAVATREALFRRIADGKTFVADMHVAFPGIGRLRSDGKDTYTWVPIEYSPLPASKRP